jgi:hypothetical protein
VGGLAPCGPCYLDPNGSTKFLESTVAFDSFLEGRSNTGYSTFNQAGKVPSNGIISVGPSEKNFWGSNAAMTWLGNRVTIFFVCSSTWTSCGKAKKPLFMSDSPLTMAIFSFYRRLVQHCSSRYPLRDKFSP